jgi:hypothetical protein
MLPEDEQLSEMSTSDSHPIQESIGEPTITGSTSNMTSVTNTNDMPMQE